MIEPFADDIWIADGAVVAIAGFEYGTRMAIIRLSTNRLFVWSPIALSLEVKSQVDALGPVQFIVAPNPVHHLFVGEWAEAYPDALLYGAPELSKKRPDIGWHGALTDDPEPGWSAEIDQVVVRGRFLFGFEAVFFHRASGTVILTDLIQHFDRTWFKGWRSIAARMDLMTAPEAEVPRKFRLAFRGRAARAAVGRILQWPIERVLMAHGEPIRADGRAFVAQRFRWLKPGDRHG